MYKKLSINLVALLFSLTTIVSAQSSAEKRQFKIDSIFTNFGKAGSFVIKGNVENFKDKFFEFATTT